MNITPFEDRVRVAAALVDGVSIRAVARMTDIHRDTIRRFGVEAGEACTRLHDALVRDVQPTFIEADELWTFGVIADGVVEEIRLAKKLGKRVRHFSLGTTLESIREVAAAELDYEAGVPRVGDLCV